MDRLLCCQNVSKASHLLSVLTGAQITVFLTKVYALLRRHHTWGVARGSNKGASHLLSVLTGTLLTVFVTKIYALPCRHQQQGQQQNVPKTMLQSTQRAPQHVSQTSHLLSILTPA